MEVRKTQIETKTKTKEKKKVERPKSISDEEAQKIRTAVESLKIEVPAAIKALGSPMSIKVLAALKHRPLSFNEIAKVLGKSPQAMFVKVQSLAKAGLLTKENSKYRVNEEALKEVKEFLNRL